MKPFSKILRGTIVRAGVICALSVSSYAGDGDNTTGLPDLTRTWTVKDEASPIEATAEKLTNKEIRLRRIDTKKNITVPFDKLTEDDRKWIKENEIYIGKSEKELKKLFRKIDVCKELKGKTRKLDGDKWVKTTVKPTAKYFIAYYSASWCGPCRASMPHSVEVYNNRISKIPDLELVWCSADRNEEAALTWAKSVNMPWPVLLPGSKNEAFQNAKPSGYPNLFLVDGDGKVIQKGGIDSLVNKAEELLKKGK